MDYQKSREYIEEAQKYGSVLGLSNMQELMKRLGNPQEELQYVHVAGTNGKGSVIACLYAVLTKAGYRVGRYVSPTLYSYRERMEIAGERISREQFARYLTMTAEVIEAMTEEGLPHPTPFEIETAVAFLYFKDQNCDLVLLEVGMGGGLDATNIIHNTRLAVLVSISMDHMAFLGTTLKEIAEKKAGIIKTGCRVVSVRQQPQAALAIEEQCRRCGVACEIADAKEAMTATESCFGQRFVYQGQTYEIALAGAYQKENAVLALKALEILDECGFATTLEQRKEGLAAAHWNGRFTVIHERPLFVVDGAHNPGAADMLAASIEKYFRGKKLYYIMGMFRDKDYRSVIQKTAPYATKILTIETPDNPRALPAEELAAAVRDFRPEAEAMDSLETAVEQVFSLAASEDVILAFGSLSFIGKITEIVKNKDEVK